MKYYAGPEEGKLEKTLKEVFTTVNRIKPKASRLESKEMYFVCLKKRGKVDRQAIVERM
jgi:21S rRNA (uridine2791-2'-O)-methyltransferase